MKKQYMKSGALLVLFTLMPLFSCKKYLDVKPYDSISDEAPIVDKASAEAAVRGAYRGLASLSYSTAFQKTIILSAGDVVSKNNAQTDLNVINYDLRSDIGFLETFWGSFYNTINRANLVIDKLPSVQDNALTNDLKNQLLGEAYFIRAYSYFDLARTFGGVQIFLTPTKLVEDKIGKVKSTQAEVYAQVLSDLNAAEALLPNTVVRNRATKYTVYALRARLHLYTNNFESAETDASLVLANTTNYKVITPFALPLTGSTESVFEVSFSANDINPGFALWNGNNRQLEPKPVLHNLLQSTTDGGGRKVLSTVSGSSFLGRIFASNTASTPLIRTAEMLLIRAEARARKSSPDLTGSLADINVIRTRSAVPVSTSATVDDLLLDIEKERRLEFALEPHRWFDLVRTGRADDVLNATDPNKYIFPIPGSEIRVNPSLVQNPGY